MKRMLILPAMLWIVSSGCRTSEPQVPASPNPPSMTTPLMMSQRDGETPKGMRVDLYHLRLPEGTISRNEKFWKRIDEHAVDPKTYEVLFKNGIRVGQASIGEWEHFRQIMAEFPAISTNSSLVTMGPKPIEVPMRKEVPSQDISFFTAGNMLEGRSFDAAENLIAMTLQPAPRQGN